MHHAPASRFTAYRAMRHRPASLSGCFSRPSLLTQRCFVRPLSRRWIQISTTPAGTSPLDQLLSDTSVSDSSEEPDAKFEVLGAPYSLLSASLAASQILYTRRGTLVGVTGKTENAVSTLSILEPFRRALLGIPFFYQKISSASPITALISTKSPITSFAVVHLDGTIDWMIAQRRALLAWTGHTLSIRPTINTKLSLAHWGNSHVTGRGLLALVGKGQIYQITLKADEEYLAHPSNVVAYTATKHPPSPYRLKSTVLRFQVPGISGIAKILPDARFIQVVRDSGFWRGLSNFLFALRTWSRRTIWGDRLFLQFRGPTTVLIQTRASRISDVLTTRDVNEIADTSGGVTHSGGVLNIQKVDPGPLQDAPKSSPPPTRPTQVSFASVSSDGKVKFEKEPS